MKKNCDDIIQDAPAIYQISDQVNSEVNVNYQFLLNPIVSKIKQVTEQKPNIQAFSCISEEETHAKILKRKPVFNLT